MLEAMLPYAGAVFTVTPDNPRAMRAEELASEAEKIVDYLWKEKAGRPEKHREQEIVRREQKIVHREQKIVHRAQELWDRFRRSGHAVP